MTIIIEERPDGLIKGAYVIAEEIDFNPQKITISLVMVDGSKLIFSLDKPPEEKIESLKKIIAISNREKIPPLIQIPDDKRRFSLRTYFKAPGEEISLQGSVQKSN